MKRLISIFLGFLFLIPQTQAQSCITPDATIWDNTWQSCQTSSNPNPIRGNSHWLRYDFGQNYELYRTRFWNHNKATELNKGVQDIIIDYSTNGISWTSLGTYRLPQAKGDAIYAGVIGPDFLGVQARYVVITILSNWGHSTCNGLAEVKFMLAPQIGNDLACDDGDLVINDNPIITDTYQAQNTLSSTGNVDQSNHVIFKASNCIELNAGFEVHLGNTLQAEIDDCVLEINP